MGDGIGDTEKVPAAQRGRLAGAIGATGGQRPDYWGVLPQDVHEYGEFLPLAGVATKERRFRHGGGCDRSHSDSHGTYSIAVTGTTVLRHLHCFQKKSKSGIAMPKVGMDIIRTRLKVAEAMARELRNAKTNH